MLIIDNIKNFNGNHRRSNQNCSGHTIQKIRQRLIRLCRSQLNTSSHPRPPARTPLQARILPTISHGYHEQHRLQPRRKSYQGRTLRPDAQTQPRMIYPQYKYYSNHHSYPQNIETQVLNEGVEC